MDLRYYLRVYRNCLDKQICEETVQELTETDDWKQHVYYNSLTKSLYPINGDRELDNSFYNVKHKTYFMDRTFFSLKTYLEDIDTSWFDSWIGYSDIRFNRYKQNSLMTEHCDHIRGIFDGERKGVPTMSVLGILNDNFDGGDLIFWQDQKIDVKPGDVIVFPSNYLYPHKVLPVTDGTRYSFVSWAY